MEEVLGENKMDRREGEGWNHRKIIMQGRYKTERCCSFLLRPTIPSRSTTGRLSCFEQDYLLVWLLAEEIGSNSGTAET